MSASLRLAGLLLLAAALAGCAHYALGPGTDLPYRTVYVAPARNTALVPQAEALLTRQVADMLARSGQVRPVNSPDTADATLTLTLTDFQRDVAARRAEDTFLADSFNIALLATATLVDNRSGEAYFTDRPLDASANVKIDGAGQQPAEYQAMPVLTRRLAREANNAVLSAW